MIVIGIFASIAAIGVLCWILFSLAVFALPLFAGVTAAIWAHEAGAGWAGAIVVGILAAALAGYHATHGIVKHTTPSDAWQIAFSVIGAIAIGITAFVRVTAIAAPASTGQGAARA